MHLLRAALVLSAALGMALQAAPALSQEVAEGAVRLRVLVPDPDSAFLAPPVRAALGKQLRALAARHLGLEVLPLTGAELAALRKTAGCEDTSEGCLLALARAGRADRVFFSQVQKLPGRSLVFTALVDAKAGKALGERRLRCPPDPRSLGAALVKGWTELVGALVKTQLKLSADVEGAEVVLDGRRIGSTPLVLTRELEAGPHELRVSSAGLGEVRKAFTVQPGQAKVVLKVELRSAGAGPVVAAAPDGAGVGGEKLRDDDGPPPEGDGGIPVVPLGPVAAKPGVPTLEEPPLPKPPLEEPPAVKPPLEEPPRVAARPEPVGRPKPAPDSLVRKPAPEGPAPVGVEGALPPPVEDPGEGGVAEPIYEKWWFWTALGAVVVAGAVTGLAVGLTQDEGGGGIPDGLGRVNVSF
ncbi:MAG TPA: PEGA domain-containing protein [Myxococcota bacterium]|nr:PEGA domain-containing protein [Myxococcota bacterium]HRY96854.1 PEGA domain-containing protein [Myxococcota bacterium]HSA22545.1 PEGA domain-containing protein [Myxococcota bacterium]